MVQRLGVITSHPPAELERLATSEATVISPMQRSGVVGKPRVIPVNGPLESCTLGVSTALNAEAPPKKYQLAECGLTVTATALLERAHAGGRAAARPTALARPPRARA